MEDEVVAVVESYVAGVTTADVALVRSAFRADARLWGYLGQAFLTIPVEGFLTVVANTPDPASWVGDYSYAVSSVDVTGEVAVAVLKETGYIGGNFTNYFSLVCEDGTWAIASKTFFLTGGEAPPGPAA